jgi:hypothetical protein
MLNQEEKNTGAKHSSKDLPDIQSTSLVSSRERSHMVLRQTTRGVVAHIMKSKPHEKLPRMAASFGNTLTGVIILPHPLLPL